MKRPIRVLHDIHWLTRGGIETWLMNLLRHFRNEDVHFDFAVCDSSYYDEEAKSYGSEIHRVSHPFHFRRFLNDMREVMKSGRYDVIHSHRPEHGGHLAKIAKELSIPCRIVHAHNSNWCKGRKSLLNSMRYWRYRCFTQPLCPRFATTLLGCSSDAFDFFFGNGPLVETVRDVVFCGVPLEPFGTASVSATRTQLMDRYGFPHDALVIGSVGSLDDQKNHDFLIRSFAELATRDPRYHLFIAGEGYRRPTLENLVRSLGLEHRVRMPGICTNIPELTCQLFDVFALTPVFEGFGVVFVEAVAAGLHVVCSDVITKDILTVIPESLTTVGLSAPISSWADALEDGIKRRRTPQEGVETIRKTPFSIENSADALLKVYYRDIVNG